MASPGEPFSIEQQEYLKGLLAGVAARRTLSASTDPQHAAQDRTIAAGGKLTPEESAKRHKPPLGRYHEVTKMAAGKQFPKGTDVFLTKWFGLFYVAPAQNAYMCRLRIPNGILTTEQFRGIATIADDLAGGYADITTRANLQLREIAADAPPEILMRLSEIGLTSQGSGADNIRNITGSPTAGIDPQELIDTRPHARALHHFIRHHPELYGLPRKFNIAFDGGGRIPVLQDTNDIAFTAIKLADGNVAYRLGLGGITGHGDFARDTGIIVTPDQTIPVANAILRVFIADGDRTDRLKARLKYLLDRIGLAAFLDRVETQLGEPLRRVDTTAIQPPPAQDRLAHLGVHPQRQPGLYYVGVVIPVGRITTGQMRGLAKIAERYGSRELRLTVWQNLLIPNITETNVPAARAAIASLGLSTQASPLRAGLIACTGNTGCKFSASDTKSHAAQLVDYLEPRVTVNAPLNIHLTGCHNSCAQHTIADIGLLAVKVGEDMIEGYDLHVGGGAGQHQRIGRLIRPAVPFDNLRQMVLAILAAWMQTRSPGESFLDWAAARDNNTLAAIADNATANA